MKISKEEFEKAVNDSNTNDLFNKLLYFYDCANILATLQNSVLETKYLLGLFYKTLNEKSFLIDKRVIVLKDGLQFASGPIVTNITSVTNHIFINLYSQLDFLTKFIYEYENLQEEFSNYPKLRSKDVLYGEAKKTSLFGLSGSLLEASNNIRKIITLRNEIVHNSSIDSMPKVYQVIKEKKIVEKFILLPDFHHGYLKTFKNRKRFFDDEIKLNEILPDLVIDFWQRLKTTLDAIK